jgi:hypothetical protein
MNYNGKEFEGFRIFALEIFRRAIPEITDEAILFLVTDNPYLFPGDGKLIQLKSYTVPGPKREGFPTSYQFTIARKIFEGDELVFALEFHIMDRPGEFESGKFYITHIQHGSGPAPAP